MMAADLWAILVIGLFFIVPAVCSVSILAKAGYSRFWAFGILVPVLNLILIWIFGLDKWPALETVATSESKEPRKDGTDSDVTNSGPSAENAEEVKIFAEARVSKWGIGAGLVIVIYAIAVFAAMSDEILDKRIFYLLPPATGGSLLILRACLPPITFGRGFLVVFGGFALGWVFYYLTGLNTHPAYAFAYLFWAAILLYLGYRKLPPEAICPFCETRVNHMSATTAADGATVHGNCYEEYSLRLRKKDE